MLIAVSTRSRPGASGVAVRADHERGQRARLDPVPAGVEEPDAEHIAVERVVEDVPADVVTRFENGGDHQVVGRERQRRQQPPHGLGGDLHRKAAADPFDDVAVEPAVHQDLGDGDRHLPGRPVQRGIAGAGRHDLQHPQPLTAEQQGHPEPVRVVGGALHLEAGERPAGQRRLDRQFVPRPAGADQGYERGLRVVGQVDHDVGGPDGGRGPAHQERQLVRPATGGVEVQPTRRIAAVDHTTTSPVSPPP
ncbi:hypothetical protein [Micromonospora sediminicola]|uniref:hypothetical protein n=1 Tax=Micromonospora sediminicola TaxID=946078 RepID=UPI0037AD05E1